MENKGWWTIGKLNIPEDKKDELNRYVLELLDKGGIRKVGKTQIGDKLVTVLEKPVPDEDGIVRFDYSILEKKERKECFYDLNTCELTLYDHGGNEFGVIMNSIIVLQEVYTKGHYYLIHNDELVGYVNGYLRILNDLLGKQFYLPNRGRVWDMMLFFRNKDIKETNFINLLLTQKDACEFADWAQIKAASIVELNNIEKNDVSHIKSKEEIPITSDNECRLYLKEIFEKLFTTEGAKLDCYLRTLFNSNINDRENMSKDSDIYGDIALLSLYMLPAEMIYIYSMVKDSEFWKIWDYFGIDGYKDTILKKKANSIPTGKIFLRVIKREYEDEFLEFWDDRELVLSELMKNRIDDWSKKINELPDIKEDEVEDYLNSVITGLENVWNCRYFDKCFVTEILSNKNKVMYRKALVLLRNIMEEDVKYFPELTKKQALEWLIKPYRDKYDYVVIMAFQSLMISKNRRREILGF